MHACIRGCTGMRIGIIDADLLDGGTRYPNLACLKISGFYKNQGHMVRLITSYDDIDNYDVVYMSKVFSYTKVPIDSFNVQRYPHLRIGGTGFFGKAAPNLPDEIEHYMPDYHLYDEFVNAEISRGIKSSKFLDYGNASIGFTTRGCFRKCSFCVNEKYDGVVYHAPVSEFLDNTRKYIYLQDDNILAYPKWRDIFDELNATGKPFQFRQGMDMRLMTEEKAKVIASSRYHGEFIFAFDNIKDRELIENKLVIWQKHTTKRLAKLYVLCGYEAQDEVDIANAFERIKILMQHQCLPYLMRHENYKKSKYKGLYITLARWCNQPNFIKKTSFREYCEVLQGYKQDQNTLCAPMLYMLEFEKAYPDIAARYYDMRWEGYGEKDEVQTQIVKERIARENAFYQREPDESSFEEMDMFA